jgi:hypothetical protein
MLELVTSNYVLVDQQFVNLREALAAAKHLLSWDTRIDHVWIRQTNGILMLGRMTRDHMHWSQLTSLPTKLV